MSEIAVGTGARRERDLLGEIEVPTDALYGAQTQRAIINFPLRGERCIGDYPRLVEGLLRVKQAAACANRDAGLLSPRLAEAIVDAVVLILKEQRYDQFPVHRFHGGGGTSANMNANEVLANLGEELLGGRRGEYAFLHPNDEVNLHQSTNDAYPTACRIAILLQWPDLEAALNRLIEALRVKGSEFQSQLRLARTCLQDAVEISFDDLFQGYRSFFIRSRDRIKGDVARLHSVNLGGTIVGRRHDVPEAYLSRVIPSLRIATGDPDYVAAASLFDAAQNPDDLVAVSSGLDLLARGLIKVAKDLRLMNSGPEAGFREIRLPAVQPGSSSMPGKINPVIPEFVIQLSMQVMGHHVACASVVDHGELDLNVWEGVSVFSVLDSMELLTSALAAFEERCIRGLDVDVERNARNASTIIPWLTKQMRNRRYSEITGACREAAGDVKRLRQLLQDGE